MHRVPSLMQSSCLLLGLGANIPGTWGAPRATLGRALSELERAGIKIVRRSNLYRTKPLGAGYQPTYLNAVVIAEAKLAPGELLRLLKRIERRAGRRLAPPLRPRPLDIDILDYGSRRLGWPPLRRGRGQVILPHPEMHSRPFVLVPLREVAPGWRHPVMGLTASAMLARLTSRAKDDVSPSP